MSIQGFYEYPGRKVPPHLCGDVLERMSMSHHHGVGWMGPSPLGTPAVVKWRESH